jgi:hypothetical protein
MDPTQQFNALFEQYIFNVANEVIGDSTPDQQKALIDLLRSVDSSLSIGALNQEGFLVEAGVASKTSCRKSRRSPSGKHSPGDQARRGILQLSIEQNQRQINNAIAYIDLLDGLIVQTENTPLNDVVKRSVVASYRRVITIYSSQLNRLKDVNQALSHSVSQLV